MLKLKENEQEMCFNAITALLNHPNTEINEKAEFILSYFFI